MSRTNGTNGSAGTPKKKKRRQQQKKKLTPKQRGFLAAFRLTGNVTKAAEAATADDHRAAGNLRRLHYRWLENDPDGAYVAALLDAKEEAADRLEIAAEKRAVAGVPVSVLHDGKVRVVGMKYSDQLLMFLLKAVRPEKYRDRQDVRHSGEITHAATTIRADLDRLMKRPDIVKALEDEELGEE